MSNPTVPTAHRCAFEAAVHLTIHEPAQIAYQDVRYDGGRFALYTGAVPAIGCPRAEREAFYDSPAVYMDGKELAELVACAGVSVGAGRPLDRARSSRRVHGKAGGWRVFDGDGRLVHVGRHIGDVRAVMGWPEPVVPDHAGHVMFGLAPLSSDRPAPALEAPKPEPAPVVVPPSPEVVEHAAQVEESGKLPDAVAKWLDRLVYAPKRAYAEKYARHQLTGAPMPVDPGEVWASKARARCDRIVGQLEDISR